MTTRSRQFGWSMLLWSALLGCSGGNEALFGATPRLSPASEPTPPQPMLRSIEPLPPPAPVAMEPPPAAPDPAPPPAAAPRPVEEPEPPPEPVACTSFGPFGEPELISGLGLTAPTLGPVFAADGLTMFFSAVVSSAAAASPADFSGEAVTDENIFSARREPGSPEFAAAEPVANLDAGGSVEGTPFLSFDGLSLYFFSTRSGPGVQGDRDIWVARRPSVDAPFEAPAVLPAVNGPDLEHLPRLSRDELSIVFVSGRDSPNGASNLWIAQRASRADDFSTPVEVPGINTAAREEGFSLSEDGRTLFFATNRADLSHMDLYVATREDPAGTFATPEPLPGLNSASQELDPQLSPDGLELFFSSDRGGTFQLFRTVRECLEP